MGKARAPGGISRREAIRLLGTATGAVMLPFNFAACTADTQGAAYARPSWFIPTPEQPLTPADDFYVNINFGIPNALPQPRAWRLFLNGLVERETSIGFDELVALPQVRREITLECISNEPGGGLISSAEVTGARLRDVIAIAGRRSSAGGMRIVGLDGYGQLFPTDAIDGDEPLIIHQMNGAPLDPAHGAPVRALFSSHYGMFSVKWLDGITLVRDYATYGALRGLATFIDGQKAPKSRIDRPYYESEARVGEVVALSGLAVTANAALSHVEVKTEGDWERAEISFDPVAAGRGPWLWSLWRTSWTPSAAGEYVVRVRAFDATGRTQREDPGFPYDASAIHSVRVLVRE